MDRARLQKIPNRHMLLCRYWNGKVIIKSERFGERISIPYDYGYDTALAVAEAFLLTHGFTVIGHGELKDWYVVVGDTFMGLKGIRTRKAKGKGR